MASYANKDFTREELLNLLSSVPAVKSDFNLLLIRLKRRQITGSSQCTKATLEIIRSLLARYNFNSTEHMMKMVRAVGRELMAAAQTELTIGNLVRRVLFFIREEHAAQKKLVIEENRARASSKDLSKAKNRRERSNSYGAASNSISNSSNSTLDTETSPNPININNPGIDAILAHLSDDYDADDFSRHYPGLKLAVISAVNELNNEIDNYAAICQRAQDYIHADECILTYGYSRLVEQFLKSAGSKRRFQLIIAEAAPSLDGHKLAQALCKNSSISITLIPDSNIYAIMARVNKVILAPQAVMADGGAICNSGHHMVAVAAKEFSVPVVCISGAFLITPLFAHNESLALQQLQSPSAIFPYETDVNFDNVEVSFPSFDHVPPSLVSIYVTNDGSHLPSYVFRQLSEFYHPKDYIL